MSLNDIYDALNRHLSGGSIDLWAAAQSEQALSGLIDALAAFAIARSFSLTGATLTPPGASVRLVGNGTFGFATRETRFGAEGQQPSMVATLDVSDPATPLFALRFDFGSARTSFSSLFPDLLPAYQQLDQATGTVATLPSFLYQLGVRQLRLDALNTDTTKVSASGLLDAEGVLIQYKSLLPGWPLTLGGSIAMPRNAQDVAAIELNGIDKRVQIPFFNNSLHDVGFALRSVRDLDARANQVTSLSALELIGSLGFGSNLPVRLRVPMTASDRTWRLIAELDPSQGNIGDAVTALAGLLGLTPDQLATPIDFLSLDRFYLSEVEVAFEPPAGTLPLVATARPVAVAAFVPNLRWLAITVQSTGTWNPPIPFVSIDRVGARWQVSWPLGTSDTVSSGSVFGGLTLGAANEINPITAGAEAFTLDVTAYLPEFVVSGNLRRELSLPIGTALNKFVGPDTPNTPAGMSLTRFSFTANPSARTFRADAEINMDWSLSPFSNVVFDLVGMSFFVDVSQPRVAAGLSASIQLDDVPAENGFFPTVTVSAMGARAQGKTVWTFEGGLLPGAPLSLTRIAKRLLDVDASGWPNFPEISIDTLGFTVETGEQGYYAANGSASLLWSPKVLDTDVRVAVSASASVTKPTGGSASGSVTGSLALNRLAMTLSFDFGVPNPTWRFRVQFGEPWIELTTFTTTDVPPHRILTAQLGGVTLGSIIEYLVNLAAPTLGYRLDPPWDALNRVDLSRFLLSLDLTTSTVTLSMNLTIDLGVMQISKLGLKYTRGAGLAGVELTLDGKFFGQDKALGWDVIRDPPPAVPGKGSLIDLYYLALGQRVRPQDQTPKTVRGYLDAMEKAMQPLPPGSTTPPPIGNGVEFAADSEWLIGLDIDLAETFRLGLLFNDPNLYGLSIALRGPKAGSFSGLDFQLLYKKISDSIGMFRIDLALPIAMRSYTFGPVAITLGTIALEVYTNGNFTIDFGYPWKRDFSRAFTLQYFPFIGRGGIYFGYLNGATSSRVPKITDGTFDPVIELGVGLAVGIGKEVIFGPLSGGAYVQIEVVFLGVFGWFNPTDHGRDPAVYFWAQATAAIVGKVYGTVDFKVIKVSVSLMIEAEAMVTFEVYRAALFHIAVRVTAEAEIKILFIKISFSFKVSLSFDFTAGSDQPTPWRLASGQGSHLSLRQRGTRLPALRRSQQRRVAALSAFQARLNRARGMLRASGDYWLNFDPKAPIFGSRQTLVLNLIPSFTLTDLPISWSVGAPANATPAWRIALLLTAETGVDAAAVTPAMRAQRSARHSLHATAASTQPAHLLCEAMLRWAIHAVVEPDGGVPAGLVTAAQLAQLADQLDLPQAADQSFSLLNLGQFFEHSLIWQIAGDPGGDPESLDAMLLPLPPQLTLGWDKPAPGSRILSDWQAIGATYIADIAAYQQRFQPMSKGAGADAAKAPPVELLEAFGSHSFRDYCLMLTKAAVKAARDQLERTQVEIKAPASLAEIAARFPTTRVDYRAAGNDTLADVGLAVGATVEELIALNPDLATALAAAPAGALLPVQLGIAPALIALDNPDAPLTGGVHALGTVYANVREGDGFAAIATRFGLPGASALAYAAVLDDVRLLGARRLIASATTSYTFAVDVAAGLGAAVFFVRWFGTAAVGEADWYAQTLSLWNADVLTGLDPAGTIVAGTALRVPTAYNDTTPPGSANYTSLAGDTPLRIGAALALQQLYSPGSGGSPPADWPAFRAAVVQNGRAISLPAAAIPVEAGESARMLGLRTLLNTTGNGVDGAGLLTWLGASPVLAPLAVIEVQGATVDTTRFSTFSAISSALGLPLVQIGSALADTPALLSASAGSPLTLTISAIPVQRIDALVADTLAGTAVADLAGQVSRQTLSGLRLPAPQKNQDGIVEASGPMTAFAELTGQQIIGPPPGDDVEPGSGITITVAPTGTVSWITFVDSTTTTGESLAALLQVQPAIAALNPALAARNDRLPPGLILRTAVVDHLKYVYSAADLKARYPVPGLALTPIEGPSALPLSALAPESFGLDHELILQTAQKLQLPGTQGSLTGQPQLFPFPNGLRVIAHTGARRTFEVVASKPGDSAAGEGSILADATFAANVRVRIQRVSDDPPLYQLVGSDADGREVLLDLVAHLGAGAVAYLAVPPDPAAADTQGLTVIDLATPAAAFLIRTNLSTASVPDSVAAAAAALRARAAANAEPLDAADLAAPAQFAQLLFEGSVVGGTGYYLSVTTRSGSGLPPGAFDNEGRAELSVIVLSADAQKPAPDGRALEPFANCALLAAGIDPSSQTLSVIATDDELGNHVATVPPGNAGFRLVLPNPRGAKIASPADPPPVPVVLAPTPTAELFGLVDYTLGAPGAVFDAGEPGLPIYPRSAEAPSWRVERAERRRRLRGAPAASVDPNPDWIFEVALPISRFAGASAAPKIPGLPDPALDPYRGLGTATSRPSAEFAIGVRDVLGNASRPGDAKSLSMEIGYTDPLLGPDAFPATRLTYAVSGNAPNGVLTLRLDALPANLWPSIAEDPGVAKVRAVQQSERYLIAWYQWSQPGLTLQAQSSLLATTADFDGGPQAVRAFVGAQYLGANALAAATPVQPASAGGELPSALADRYGFAVAHFATANAAQSARSVLQGLAVPMPGYVVVLEGDTAVTLVARTPDGILAPTPEALLNLDANSQRLPLRPGTLLSTELRTETVAALDPTPAILHYADLLGTTPGQLALDNAKAELLHPGFVFAIDDVPLAVNYLPAAGALVRSFDEAVAAYADLGVHIGSDELAEAVRDQISLLKVAAVLSSTHYQVPPATADQPFETLADNGSGSSAWQLAKLNTATRNLFDSGAMVYVGDYEQRPVVADEDLASFAEWIQRYGATPTQLLQRMDEVGVALPSGSTLRVPGMLALATDPALRIGARVPAAISVEALVGRFDYGVSTSDAVRQFVRDQLQLPHLLDSGVRVAVSLGGNTYATDTEGGDTLSRVLARLQAQASAITVELLADSIAPRADLLTVGALIVVPLARLDDDLDSNGVAARYAVAIDALAGANIGTHGALLAGVELRSPTDPTQKQITHAHDSWNAVLARFADQGNALDLSALVLFNRDVVVYAKNARLLLPVASVVQSVALTSFDRSHAIFALDVAFVSTRPTALIDPDFAGSTVERVLSPLQPARGDADADAQLALAADLRAALPELRLASGRVPDSAANLWLIDFGSSGIAKVDLAAAAPGLDGERWPRFYALRPLYPTLVSRVGVQLPVVNADGTLGESPNGSDFVGIDVETWARRYLADVDRLLAGPSAAALYRDPDARGALTKALKAKRLLAIGQERDGVPVPGTGVAAGLAPVLTLQAIVDAGARANASRTLAQALGSNLSTAYASAAVIQYDTTVDSNWTRVPGGPGARLYGDGLPDPASPVAYTLTSARIDLTATHSTAEFILGLDKPTEHKSIAFAPSFRPTHLEWNIQGLPLDGNAGYESSNWLTLIPAFTPEIAPPAIRIALGNTQAPIPLRAFPSLPSVQAQTAEASHPDASTLEQLALWTYGFSYRHEHAAQDELVVNIRFNLADSAARAGFKASEDVATCLARYLSAADTLFAMQGGDHSANAADSLATLMLDTAQAWSGHFARRPSASLGGAAGPAAGSYWLDVQLIYSADGNTIQAIDVTRLPDPDQPDSAATAPGPNDTWPLLVYRAPDGSEYALTGDAPLPPALTRRYQFTGEPPPSAAWAEIDIRYADLPLAAWQNATGSVAVLRNRALISHTPTDPAFVYASARVQAAGITTPLLRWTQAVDIGQGSGPIAGLVTAMSTLFGQSPVGQPVSLAIGYGYELAAGLTVETALRTVLPVSLMPRTDWSDAIAAALAQLVSDWQDTYQPATTNALYQFGLTLYSGQAALTTPPLLSVEQLIWRV